MYVAPAVGDAVVFVQKKGDDKTQVTTSDQVLDNQMVVVETGTASVTFAASDTGLHLNTDTRLRYVGQENGANVVRLENKEIWSKVAGSDVIFDLINYQVFPGNNTVVNISKNNLFTTISVLDGIVTVRDDEFSSEVVGGQQVQIQSFKTLEESFASIGSLSDDFRASDWYTLNNGDTIDSGDVSDGSSGTSGSSSKQGGSPLLFEFPQDEATVESDSIIVKGRILSSLVARIVIGTQTAQIDYSTSAFSFEEMNLTEKENDLIYRVYSASGDLMYKGVITVYLSKAPSGSGDGDLASVQSYPPAKAGYNVISPAATYYTTDQNVVRIDGVVPAGQVDHIEINGFQLSKFPSGGANWYYFANAQFGNLNDGTNMYEIAYYDDADEIVHRQLFIINKVDQVESSGGTASGEATVSE